MKHITLTLLAILISIATTAQRPERKIVRPDYLKPGDKIALISPSYRNDSTAVDTAAMVLREWGYEPVIGRYVDSLYLGRYAGNALQRAEDIRMALEDPEIKAIICNRGGYGTIHLVDMMSPEEFTANPKWMVGFSDITTLLAMATCGGVMGVHGTVGGYIAKYHGTDTSSVLLRDLLEGRIPEYTLPSHPDNICGKGDGILVGGNICTFAPLLNTPADPTNGGDFILFIEEVGESYHNIDRQVNVLLLNGVIDRCKGVILGEFTDCRADLEWDSAEEMVCSYLKGRDIPVMCGFPAGHDTINLPLIMGAQTHLYVSDTFSTLSFDL